MKTLKRRRKENKTDYLKRLKLLKSGSPRVVFRKTNRYILSQYTTSKQAQDRVEINVNSKQLLNYGWPKEFSESLKTITASYLSGLLMGKKIIKKSLAAPIVDFGMIRTVNKTKVYAFLKGLKDAGLKIVCKDEAFPSEDTIEGKYMKKDFSSFFDKIKSQIIEEK